MAAASIRMAIGGPYASLHVRRSDKLVAKSRTVQINGQTVEVPAACNPDDCKERDRLTRPEAIEKSMQLWLPAGAHVYIGSTEPPSFFAPLRRTYRLHFAEDFGAQLANITNNYALYAVETLVFFGCRCRPSRSASSRVVCRRVLPRVEHARAARAAAASTRRPRRACRRRRRHPVPRPQRNPHNGVLYGQACANNPLCGKQMALVLQPRSCGKPPLSERLMLSNNRSAAKARCAPAVRLPMPDSRRALGRPPRST